MAPVGPSFFTVSDRPPASREGSEIGPIVVWLWGEHDISTIARYGWHWRAPSPSMAPGSSST